MPGESEPPEGRLPIGSEDPTESLGDQRASKDIDPEQQRHIAVMKEKLQQIQNELNQAARQELATRLTVSDIQQLKAEWTNWAQHGHLFEIFLSMKETGFDKIEAQIDEQFHRQDLTNIIIKAITVLLAKLKQKWLFSALKSKAAPNDENEKMIYTAVRTLIKKKEGLESIQDVIDMLEMLLSILQESEASSFIIALIKNLDL